MRFILNFIFYALLFYVIWLFFPEVFDTGLKWLNQGAEVVMEKTAPYLHRDEKPLKPSDHVPLHDTSKEHLEKKQASHHEEDHFHEDSDV